MAAGTVFVGDFKAGVLHIQRSSASVDITDSGMSVETTPRDRFTHNLYGLRAEARYKTILQQPKAIVKVTVTALMADDRPHPRRRSSRPLNGCAHGRAPPPSGCACGPRPGRSPRRRLDGGGSEPRAVAGARRPRADPFQVDIDRATVALAVKLWDTVPRGRVVGRDGRLRRPGTVGDPRSGPVRVRCARPGLELGWGVGVTALGEARTAVDAALASVGVPVYAQPPQTVTAPCVVLVPGSPWITRRGHVTIDVWLTPTPRAGTPPPSTASKTWWRRSATGCGPAS